jgi:uncharacterized protein
MNLFLKSFFLILLISSISLPQDTTVSLTFKNNKPHRKAPVYHKPDLPYTYLQKFRLMQSAQGGDALAQHELGIRYLLGQDFAPDTVEAAKWILKAANTGLASANYNIGIFLLNGWGVDWNPVEAFNRFKAAADDNMPLAQMMLGIFYTDNLVVPKDFNTAYSLVKKAYDNGLEDAKDVLMELEKKISPDVSEAPPSENKGHHSAEFNNYTSGSSLIYFDFEAARDTNIIYHDSLLLKDVTLPGNERLAEILNINKRSIDSILVNDSTADSIFAFSNSGNPEALTIIGRIAEGKFPWYKLNEEDIISAAAFYIRAAKYDSPRAPYLLYKLIQQRTFFPLLKKKTDQKNSEALFVWYGLYDLNFTDIITEKDAINFLNQAVSQNYIPAVIELGLLYYMGKYLPQEIPKAISLWSSANKGVASEAEIRIAAHNLLSTHNSNVSASLHSSAEKGSLLALVTLAHAYETGKGLTPNKAEAAKLYRMAAGRGSSYAYDQLKKMYALLRQK